jgi:hypothetical protein
MTADTAPARSRFQAIPREGLEYIVASEGGKPVAVFLLVTIGDGAECHFCFSPHAWGDSERIARAFIEWVWVNYTNYSRLLGPVPSHNRLCRRLALAVGFEPLATLPGALTRRGTLYSILLLEIQRPG